MKYEDAWMLLATYQRCAHTHASHLTPYTSKLPHLQHPTRIPSTFSPKRGCSSTVLQTASLKLPYLSSFSLSPRLTSSIAPALYSPTQIVIGFTLSNIVDKRWSRVSSLLPLGTCLHLLVLCVGFRAPISQLFLLVVCIEHC